MAHAPSPPALAEPLPDIIDGDGASERSGRTHRLASAFLIALAFAFGLAVIGGAGLGPDAEGGARLGGDYPAFHAAGSIVLDGDVDELYDADRQSLEQRDLGIDGYLAFAYAPHVAVVYAPLAALGFRIGYAVHTLMMVAALVAAIRIMPVGSLTRRVVPSTALALGFWPMFRAVGGGQNTAVTVLLFAAAWRLLDDDRQVGAGLIAAALLYRPQYALPLMAVMALDGRWRAVGTAAAAGVATWLATAFVLGFGWVSEWMDQVLPFVERDAEVNAANSISLLGLSQALLGSDDPLAVALGLGGAIAVTVIVAWTWRPGNPHPLALRIGLLAAGVLLLSPHTMFYDAGLLVVAAGSALALANSADERSAVASGIGVVWALGFVQLASPTLGFSPLALVVVGVFVVGAHAAVTADRRLRPELGHA